jgi:hypothetical protein
MMEHNDEDIRKLLKQAVPPVRAELQRDLWPGMRRRLNEGQPRLPWYD